MLLDPVANHLHRIQELLVEWPDHPVLLQLLQIASTILSFPLDTPVMKVLFHFESYRLQFLSQFSSCVHVKYAKLWLDF